MASKEKVAEVLQNLQDGVQEIFASEKYAMYLRTMAKFRHYSINNIMLIYQQMPSATSVAGYHDWIRKFHRYVRKGEHGIKILAPIIRKKKDEGTGEEKEVITSFRMVTVFDLSQTEGKDLPSIGISELQGDVLEYNQLMDALIAIAPVPVRFDRIDGDAKGYYSVVEKEIVIKDGMQPLQNIKTMLHEMAHSMLHADAMDKSRETKEIEAESIAFAVASCLWQELDTSQYSFPYVASWSSGKEMKELKASLETIRKTTVQILDKLEGFFNEC